MHKNGECTFAEVYSPFLLWIRIIDYRESRPASPVRFGDDP